MGTSSGTNVLEKVLTGGGREKGVERRIQTHRDAPASWVTYLAPKSSLIIASMVINHEKNFGIN